MIVVNADEKIITMLMEAKTIVKTKVATGTTKAELRKEMSMLEEEYEDKTGRVIVTEHKGIMAVWKDRTMVE